MSTKRTPIHRPPRGGEFSPAALAAFRKMQRLDARCTCEPIDWDRKYWDHDECPACARWWQQHNILWGELKLKLWEWPAVKHPDAMCPYPEGCEAALKWKPDLEAQERYRALDAALKEQNK